MEKLVYEGSLLWLIKGSRKYPMILCKVIRDTLQSNTYYLGKYHVILFSLSFSSLSFSLG